jgi:hypothetical protein
MAEVGVVGEMERQAAEKSSKEGCEAAGGREPKVEVRGRPRVLRVRREEGVAGVMGRER